MTAFFLTRRNGYTLGTRSRQFVDDADENKKLFATFSESGAVFLEYDGAELQKK